MLVTPVKYEWDLVVVTDTLVNLVSVPRNAINDVAFGF